MSVNLVLFEGLDAGGYDNLWVTNGTAAGTSELSVAGTFSTLYPTDLTVFGGKVLFGGYDANNEYNLWVTNGTGAGTSELSVAGENSSGLLSANQSDLTVFGSEVLFN